MPTYESHVTTSPVFAAPAKITYPFANQGDTATKMVHQPLLQLADRYAPPTLGTAFVGATDANFSGSPVTIGSAYCIGDTEPQPADAGLVSFTRMWANIPASRTVPTGTTLYQFVGLPGGVTGALKTVTAITFGSVSTVLTVAAHGYSIGDFIYASATFGSGGFTTTLSEWCAITAVTTDTLTISNWAWVGAFTFYSGSVASGDIYRKTFQGKTTTFTRYDYALPGVTSGISTAIDFSASPEFKPVATATGQSISDYEDLQNKLSTATTPTDAAYRTMIKNRDLLVAESDIAVWLGSILERKTLMVRAL